MHASVSNNASEDLHALLTAAVDAIIVIDANGVIESFNPAAEEMFALPAASAVGLNVSTLMPEPDRSLHDEYISRYLATGTARVIGAGREVTGRCHDGRLFPAKLSVGQISHDPARFVGIIHDLTTEKQIEAALVRERDRAQQYLELAQVMLVALDRQANVLMINRKGFEILGYAEQDLIGQNWVLRCIPEDDAVSVRQAFDAVLRGAPEHEYYENYVRTSSGEQRLIAWRNQLTRDSDGQVTGTLSSGLDITEQRLAEDALRNSETLLSAAQRIARLGNFELHLPPHEEDYVSREALNILGLEQEGWRGALDKAAGSIIHPDDREITVREFQSALASGGGFSREVRICRSDDEVRHVHCLINIARDDQGRACLLSGILHDLTERKLAEAEARRAHERLTHVSRLSTMGEMAAGIAHEINQPLTAISNYAQASRRFLSSGADDAYADVDSALQKISAQAVRAGQVIRRLRTLVKQQAGKRELLDGNRLVHDIVTLAESDARSNQVVLRLDLATDLPPVQADAVQIQQVMLNLLRNSIDASLEVNGDARHVVIRTRLREDDVEFAVQDNGCGIPRGKEEHLFEPFFTTKQSGTGLGLSISRSIVRAHGGQIRYVSHEGAGSTFAFTLPTTTGDPQ